MIITFSYASSLSNPFLASSAIAINTSDMCPYQFLVLTLLCFHYVTIFASNIPVLENIAISCGSSGSSTALNGRFWIGDTGSIPSTFLHLSGKSTKSRVTHHHTASTDAVPYKTARISRHEFTYNFQVKAGQKFIRLHFSPASYKGFKKSRAFFTVKAGPYTLLNNFSASLTAGASGARYFSREFCVNIEENQAFTITFSPAQGKRGSKDSYAFVNGIEIVSMPTGLYFTRDGDPGPFVVGQKYRFYIDNSTALEMVHRLNIGGNFISSAEDGSMFRSWDADLNYPPQNGGLPIKRIIPIKYAQAPSYLGPLKVYQTARSMVPEILNRYNLTWKIPVDLGFRYLVRLHFCELESEITECGQREFTILINNQVAEGNADVIKWGGGHGVAVYRDYVVLMDGDRMEGKRYLNITLKPNFASSGKETAGILNGLEIFKLSNPDNMLASTSSTELKGSPRSGTKEHKRMMLFNNKNAIATALTVIITLLNIIAYHVRRLSETSSGARNLKSSSSENLCRRFSINEIRSTTNDFSAEFLIGSGGYGKVYKGSVDGGATIVAIKRLKSESRQGANEFWTEIKMLSKLRHEHLVPLIGYCDEAQEMILVYEYMTRGTLADHLYKIGRHGGNIHPLSWEQRLKISIGAAHGLYFLHAQRVIHRDVKSSNILVDENWVAKISDFGLSKMGAANESFTHISTNVKGTFGYLDPEYFLTKKLTRKSDVYAFGVVLFEVLSGRPAVDIRLEEEQHSLAAWARYCIRKGKVDKLIDRHLIGQISSACLKVFVGIAGRCLDTHPHERPPMADVVMSLELALGLQQNPDSSEQVEDDEDMSNVAGSCSDRSDGIISFEEFSINPFNGGMEQSKELSGTLPGTKDIYVLRNSKKDNNSNTTTSSRWWWDPLGLVPRSPSKSKASTLQEGLRQFCIQEIRKATNNFQNSFIIGFGGSDSVYKGHIESIQRVVAIRRSSTGESRLWMKRELQSKMEMGPSPRHAHVVSPIGYCNDEPEVILIYEYMANGTLHDHLCDPNKDPLQWKRRLQICNGIAQGLSCLQSTIKQTNLHRNLKSINIFLDDNWVAKVSDFGLSRRRGVSGVPTIVRGNWGFLDSDYIRDDQLTEKSYIFSFGLLLFEVLCATKESTRWLDDDQVTLSQWIKSGIRNNLSGHIDPYLAGKIPPECIRMFVETASKCLLDRGTERPSMSDIVASLEAALRLQEAAESAEGSVTELTL